MSASSTPPAGRRQGAKRRFARAVAVVAPVALAVTMAAPAWATPSATVTVAPTGSGSLFITVANTGPETITGYIATPPGEQFAVNITTGQVCQFQTFIGATRSCAVTVAPATSAQICFAGNAPELYPGLEMFIQPALAEPYRIKASISPVAPPCPFPPSGAGSGSTSGASGMPGAGSTSGASGMPGSGGGGGSSASPVTMSKGAHSWSRARCKNTYKAWTKTHRKAHRLQRKAEASKLHKAHGCPLSILK